MNRFRKEETKKKAEARMGLSEEEIQELNEKENQKNRIIALANEIHLKIFSEEYDYMLDEYADSNRRALGENPMSEEYTKKVNARRKSLGVPPLTLSGMSPEGNDSFEVAMKMANEQFNKTKERNIDELQI